MLKKVIALAIVAACSIQINAAANDVEVALVEQMSQMGCTEEQINAALTDENVKAVVAQYNGFDDVKSSKYFKPAVAALASLVAVYVAWHFDVLGLQTKTKAWWNKAPVAATPAAGTTATTPAAGTTATTPAAGTTTTTTPA